MESSGQQAASFIPILYQTLSSNGLGNQVGITCCDSEGWDDQKTMTAALVSAGMEQYLKVITSHSYTSSPTSPLATKLKVWQTEAADLNDNWSTTWYSSGGASEGLTWANRIFTGIVNANLSAYLHWEGLEVNESGSSDYLVASDGTTVTPSGRLWAFAMWSRFIRPGAYRVSTSGTISGVGIGAFKNTDGSVIVIFTNTGGTSESAKVGFSGYTPSSAEGYLTDNSNSVASTIATLSGGSVTVSIPARSVVTVKITAGTSSSTQSLRKRRGLSWKK